ncbi:deoxyribose-phosphate aldolase [Halobacillus sp. HZG1]|uniref:class I fructose-bisphosphate aldolase n=1 Tax=Halobacillus sp. HZG1 TaxID=3111769 RepID=UPI002DBE5D81|nr:deoxyribose-phosphate aldolase [Halobacillus sp. HZG1]MEC3885154.1 deoxyribose-phosphate aldolase [Halobacillus sp. HZG1]
MNYKPLRMHRLFPHESQKSLFLPIDHGTTLGPLKGLVNVPKLVSDVQTNHYQAVIAHKGVIQSLMRYPELRKMEYILHLSASTSMGSDASFKQQVTSVEHALRLGVSGISLHTNLGVMHEHRMLREFGEICDTAYKWGLPVLVMMNVAKEENTLSDSSHGRKIAHAVRIAGEMGADMVKVECPDNLESLPDIINSFDIPIFIAGGIETKSKVSWFESLEMCLNAGARGLCIGRNVFEDENPFAMSLALKSLVHDQKSASQAYELYTNTDVLITS